MKVLWTVCWQKFKKRDGLLELLSPSWMPFFSFTRWSPIKSSSLAQFSQVCDLFFTSWSLLVFLLFCSSVYQMSCHWLELVVHIYSCTRKNNSPKDIYILIPRRCEYVALNGETNVVNVTKINELKMEKLS